MKCEAGHTEYNPLCVCCDQLDQELEATLKAALANRHQRADSNGHQRADSNERPQHELDVLDLRDGKVLLGVLTRAKPIEVPLENFVHTEAEAIKLKKEMEKDYGTYNRMDS